MISAVCFVSQQEYAKTTQAEFHKTWWKGAEWGPEKPINFWFFANLQSSA